MKYCRVTTILLAFFAATTMVRIGGAHGPQIQTTADAGKIITREIIDEDSYSSSLSNPKSVYVMPLAEYLGVWRAQPDGTRLPDGVTPEFVGWPGFAYGFGYDATTNAEPFPVGSKFVLGFTSGLKSWDGAAFVDAGATEAEIYRGPSATPTALAKTTDLAPFGSVMFPGGSGVSFVAEQGDVHNTVHYRMVGDGSSTTSPLADGIYLLGLQLSSTSASLSASDPFYYVLSKNGSPAAIQAAVASLGFDANRVQNLVPEPTAVATALCGALGVAMAASRRGVKARRI